MYCEECEVGSYIRGCLDREWRGVKGAYDMKWSFAMCLIYSGDWPGCFTLCFGVCVLWWNSL